MTVSQDAGASEVLQAVKLRKKALKKSTMKVFGKFKILRILVSTSFIKAGRLQRMPRRWYLSVTTVMYLFSTIVLIYNFCEQVSMLADEHPPGGPSMSFQTGNVNSTLHEPSPEDEEPPPPPKNDSSSTESEESVIKLTTTTNNILSNLISIVLRIFGFAFFPQIRRSFQSLMAREFSAACYRWNRNEFIFILVIICAVALQIYQLIGKPPFHFSVLRRSYKVLFQVFSRVFMAQCYPLDCASFALLVFTTVVTQNLEEMSSYLGPSKDRDEIDNGACVEKELETLLDLQLSVKMNPSAVAVKNKAGNEARDKKSEPLFILRHYPTLEIRGSEDLAYLTQRYLRWYELWKEASGVTGFVTLLIFLNCAVNLCIYAYTGLTDLGNDGLLDRETLENLALAFLSILRLLCLGNAAQYLVDAGEELEEKLILEAWEEENSRYFVSLDIEKQKQISYLLHHMAQNPIHLSALGFFTASRSTLTSIAGVIVTYLVVLIQFGSQ